MADPRTTPYLGQIAVYGYHFVPDGWALCDGTILAIRENIALMQLIGTTYGGDGIASFALPNLPPITPNGPYYYIAMQGLTPTQ